MKSKSHLPLRVNNSSTKIKYLSNLYIDLLIPLFRDQNKILQELNLLVRNFLNMPLFLIQNLIFSIQFSKVFPRPPSNPEHSFQNLYQLIFQFFHIFLHKKMISNYQSYQEKYFVN